MARFLTRVRLENYKSIAHCDVELQDLTFLVGPNGAGKSNFLSALRFLSNATRTSLELVTTENGSASVIMKNGSGENLSIVLKSDIYEYSIILSRNNSSFNVYRESFDSENEKISFTARSEDIWVVNKDFPSGEFLVNLDVPHFSSNDTDDFVLSELGKHSLFTKSLKKFSFYSFIPNHYLRPENPTSDGELLWDGRNISGVILNLQKNHPDIFFRMNTYLSKISNGIKNVWVLQAGGFNILQFDSEESEIVFSALQVSDGTLHALGVLTAIFHAKAEGFPLVCIEEPEAGLHPAAARVLYDALAEVSQDVQIIVTSHSPDLLDNPDISPDSILAVVRENGETKIGPIDDVSRQVLNEHMFTAGELLRLNRLQPAA